LGKHEKYNIPFTGQKALQDICIMLAILVFKTRPPSRFSAVEGMMESLACSYKISLIRSAGLAKMALLPFSTMGR
jgi:hypothetical protein